jgi:hypothetical protein
LHALYAQRIDRGALTTMGEPRLITERIGLNPGNTASAAFSAPETLDADGLTVDAGDPVALFSLRPGAIYEAAPDGRRFLISTPTDDTSTSPITVVLNWHPPSQ